MRPATRCGASLLFDRSNRGSSVDSGARPPVALAGAASTATVHIHLRMNELRKPSRVSGGIITSCRFDPFAAVRSGAIETRAERCPRAHSGRSTRGRSSSRRAVGPCRRTPRCGRSQRHRRFKCGWKHVTISPSLFQLIAAGFARNHRIVDPAR